MINIHKRWENHAFMERVFYFFLGPFWKKGRRYTWIFMQWKGIKAHFFMNMKMRSSKRNSIKSKRQNIENFSYFLHDYVMFDPCLLIHNVKQEWVLKFRVTHNSILFLFFNQDNTSHCHRLISFPWSLHCNLLQ